MNILKKALRAFTHQGLANDIAREGASLAADRLARRDAGRRLAALAKRERELQAKLERR